MTKLTITKEPSVTYKVRGVASIGGWADITIREWEGGGSFSCQSDYGDYAYTWGSIGQGNLREFLCWVDKDYFLKKTRPKDYRVFDSEATHTAVREEILLKRRDRILTREEARACWYEYEEIINGGNYISTDSFFYHLRHLELLDILWENDYEYVPTREKYNPECDAFWENIWPYIIEYWKEELK